jgi:SET domain-containing protein
MIKTYRSSKTVIKTSAKGGKGLFAIEGILPDEIIAIRAGHIVNTEEALKLDKEFGDFSLQISDEFYIAPRTREEIEDIAIFINHSCDPNIGLDGQISLVAIRNIKAGEELCLDYAMAITGDYKMNCNCGNSNCRKLITAVDWKKKELQKRYGKYFSWFIYKKIHSLD